MELIQHTDSPLFYNKSFITTSMVESIISPQHEESEDYSLSSIKLDQSKDNTDEEIINKVLDSYENHPSYANALKQINRQELTAKFSKNIRADQTNLDIKNAGTLSKIRDSVTIDENETHHRFFHDNNLLFTINKSHPDSQKLHTLVSFWIASINVFLDICVFIATAVGVAIVKPPVTTTWVRMVEFSGKLTQPVITTVTEALPATAQAINDAKIMFKFFAVLKSIGAIIEFFIKLLFEEMSTLEVIGIVAQILALIISIVLAAGAFAGFTIIKLGLTFGILVADAGNLLVLIDQHPHW